MSPTISSEAKARRLAYAIAPGVLLAGVAGGIAFPVLPLIGLRAGLPLWFIGTILAANRAARFVCAPLAGSFTDRFGGRRAMVLGLALQVAVMALYLLGVVRAQPGLYFLIARLLHGPASVLVFVGAQTLALHAGGVSHAGIASATVRAAMPAGMPIGLAAGGLLSGLSGDQAMFEGAIAVMVLASVIAFLSVPDLRAEDSAQRRHRPKGEWKLFATRHFTAVGMLNFASFFSAQGVVLTTIALLVDARGLRVAGLGAQATAGLAMAWMVVISSVTMAVVGPLGDRWNAHARIAMSGMVLTVPGLVMVGVGHSIGMLAAGIGLVGIGMGALGPSVLALLATVIPPNQRGRASGVLQWYGDLGGMTGPIIGTTLIVAGEAVPYLVCAGTLVLLLPVAGWLVRLERRQPIKKLPPGVTR